MFYLPVHKHVLFIPVRLETVNGKHFWLWMYRAVLFSEMLSHLKIWVMVFLINILSTMSSMLHFIVCICVSLKASKVF